MQRAAHERWIGSRRTRVPPGVPLICLPYAGGSAVAYGPLTRALPKTIDVCPLHLPGRDSRFREEPSTDLVALAEEAAHDLVGFLNGPFAVFGHSMGALLGFELVRALERNHGRSPERFFASAHTAPGVRDEVRDLDLSDDGLLAYLREQGGTAAEVFDNPELLEMVLPVLRADLDACGAYPSAAREPIDAPITVMLGVDDPVTRKGGHDAWATATRAGHEVLEFPGGHFYINDSLEDVAGVVVDRLRERLAG